MPVGSTVWVITSHSSFQFRHTDDEVLRCLVGETGGGPGGDQSAEHCHHDAADGRPAARLDTQGMPQHQVLVAVLIIYIGVIGHSWGNRKMERSKSLSSWTVMVFLEWYYLLLVANALAGPLVPGYAAEGRLREVRAQ